MRLYLFSILPQKPNAQLLVKRKQITEVFFTADVLGRTHIDDIGLLDGDVILEPCDLWCWLCLEATLKPHPLALRHARIAQGLVKERLLDRCNNNPPCIINCLGLLVEFLGES
jgi:hypothetical protein